MDPWSCECRVSCYNSKGQITASVISSHFFHPLHYMLLSQSLEEFYLLVMLIRKQNLFLTHWTYENIQYCNQLLYIQSGQKSVYSYNIIQINNTIGNK